MAGNVSLLQFGEGGSILSDAIVILHDPRFIMGDYGGKSQAVVPMLRLPMIEVGEGGEELEHVQLFSVGGAKDFIPDDTGMGLVKVGSKDAIVKNSNFAVFVQSILDCGFPPERTIDNDISWLKGIKCHVTRKAVTREGMTDQKKEATVLIVDKLYMDEKGGKAKAGAKVGAGVAPGKKGAAALDDAFIEEAKSVLMQVLYSDAVQAAGGAIMKNALIGPVLSLIRDNPNKKDLTRIIVSDTFLTLCDGWLYEAGMLTAG